MLKYFVPFLLHTFENSDKVKYVTDSNGLTTWKVGRCYSKDCSGMKRKAKQKTSFLFSFYSLFVSIFVRGALNYSRLAPMLIFKRFDLFSG